MLAANLKPNEIFLAKYEMNSIKTSKGTKPNGVPDGTKKLKNLTLCIDNPNIVTPISIVNDKPIETIIDVVIVKE